MTSHSLELRDSLAVSVARTAGYWSRWTGHGGSSLPGLIAERIAPGVSGRLAARMDAIAVISGTNGKTTTTHLLDHILETTGSRVITNRSGANLSQSISTTVLDAATQASRARPVMAVLECDEFALPDLALQFQPEVIVLTNLFRDQLDRYMEIDAIERRWATLLGDLPNTTIVAPADDPRLAWLASRAPGGSVFYGVNSGVATGRYVGLTHDSEDCPSCGRRLEYSRHTIGHLGRYRCASCGFGAQERWLELDVVESHGFDGQTIRITRNDSSEAMELKTSLPGTANAYNIGAAICAAHLLGVDPREAIGSLNAVSNAWGRFETATIEGHRVILTLGKNPASVAELLQVAEASDIAGVLFVMNDGFQDGRDVSWYWDVDPAMLANDRLCAIAGARALDLALRVKYAEDRERPQQSGQLVPMTFADPMAGLRALLDATSTGATVLAISTYTGLVELRAALVASNVLERMPV